MDKFKFPMNLQFFADEGEEAGSVDDGSDGDKGSDDKGSDDKDVFTKEEIKEIVSERLKRERKRLAREKDEAIREAEEKARERAKMTAEQQEKAEREELENELASYRQREKEYRLRDEAKSLLSSKGFTVTDKQLDTLIREDSEQTEMAVNNFVELVEGTVQSKMKESARQTSPLDYRGKGKNDEDNYGAKLARKYKPKGE